MTSVNLNELPLNEFIGKTNQRQHCQATFPLFAPHGTQNIATVYFEIQPGEELGRHTDSMEELLIVLEGKGEAEIDGQRSKVSQHSITLVPKMLPHNVVNTGLETLKVLGVFGGGNHLVATFEEPILPIDTHIVNTKMMLE